MAAIPSPEYQFGAQPRFADLEPALRLRRLTDPRPPTVPLASAGGPPPRMGVRRYPQPNGPRRPHCTIPTSAPFTIFADGLGSGTMLRFAGFWICGRALDGSLAAVTVVSLSLGRFHSGTGLFCNGVPEIGGIVGKDPHLRG